MTSSITTIKTLSLTDRLQAALLCEQRELGEENTQVIVALDATIDMQNRHIQAVADENALLKGQVEQLRTEAQATRETYLAQMTIIQDQQKLIQELRAKNSELTQSDQTIKEMLALYEVLKNTTSSEKLRCLPYLNLCYMDQLEIKDWTERFEREMRGGHYEPIINILQKATKEAPL